jgi:hypothetical protein
VDSLFLLLWLPRRDFCSLFLLLWLSLGISAGFPVKRDLFEKILENWNLRLRDLNPQSSSLFTIENFSPVPGIEPGSALPIMSLLHLLQSSIDAVMKLDNSSSRWGEQALSLEVPCQGSWCRCQTYPTWAPTMTMHMDPLLFSHLWVQYYLLLLFISVFCIDFPSL